jgi:bacillopeptidase F
LGHGVVVANMDTGVDGDHPDLRGSWRGGANSWFDPFDGSTQPYDINGHGTATMGIMVGSDSSGTYVGAAPGASWIAAKIFDDMGNTSESIIHQGFLWLLDPDGDPSTPDAPAVVNASWGTDDVGTCDLRYQLDLAALRAANILVVFAAGNSGPAQPSSVSPADNPGSFAAGAVDRSDHVAAFSSRGPSACTGGVFPDVVAPGVNVPTTGLSLGGIAQYTSVSGTSFAAPHVAAAAALLAGAFPGVAVSDVEQSLQSSARDLGPNHDYGHGGLDVFAAYQALLQTRAIHRVPKSPCGDLPLPVERTLCLRGAVQSLVSER